MSLQIERVDPAVDSKWDEQVFSHPRGSVFHSRAWSRVLSDVYGHRPVYLRASLNNEVAALLPLMEVRSIITGRRGVSLPFSDYCDPLIFQPAATPELAEQIYRLARSERWKYFELRGEGLADGAAASSSYFAHRLSLPSDPQAIFANFEPANQRAIRKAERNNLTVEYSSEPEAVTDFFTLHTLTRRRHGLPPQPKSFFDAIQSHLLAKGRGFLVIVRKEAKPVASALFFHRGRTSIYKFGASDFDFQEARPSNLAMWHGIQELVRRGATELHFGRTDREQDGLRRFKTSWGAAESTLNYHRFNLRNNCWIAGSGRKTPSSTCPMFRSLPLAVNRAAGALIYPHLD